jgi:hypothetical protein
MAKFVEARPAWLSCASVDDVFSVSNCISDAFCDYTNLWKHNGYWLFDSPALVREVADAVGADLAETTLFYYEAHELEYVQNSKSWRPFNPEECGQVAVEPPANASLEGFDVVTFFAGSSPECSPLSCNDLAGSAPVNRHCLFGSLSEAFAAIEGGLFSSGERGPLRVFSVYTVPWSVA